MVVGTTRFFSIHLCLCCLAIIIKTSVAVNLDGRIDFDLNDMTDSEITTCRW